MKIITAFCLLLVSTAGASCQTNPKDYTIPAETLSPDHRYGVTVPLVERCFKHRFAEAENRLVSMQDGHVLAVIDGMTGWDRALNFLALAPARWSSNGSLLLWEVTGKWCPNTLTLVKIKAGKVEWQTDVLHLAQEAIVARTKKQLLKNLQQAKRRTQETGPPFPKDLRSMSEPWVPSPHRCVSKPFWDPIQNRSNGFPSLVPA